MIEVKGTRSPSSAKDPTDPLGFRKPIDTGTGGIAGVLTGILGLAVYLRSFLWAEPAAAQAELPETRQGFEDGKGAARPKSPPTLTVAANDAEAPAASNEETSTASATLTLPAVFGPFEFGIIAPVQVPVPPGFTFAVPANNPLPPFDGPKGQPPAEAGEPRVPAYFPGAEDALPDLTGLTFADGEETRAGETGNGPSGGTGTTPPSRNRAPRNSGPVYLGDVGSGATLAIALSHLLVNSSDEDGDNLAVVMNSASAGLIQPHNAGWRFLAESEELGEVQISYRVSDGSTAVVQTAVVRVIENLFEGSETAELLLGTEGRDRVLALAGDDNIAVFGGRDVVFGGAGADNIAGGAGRDTLFGEEGNDLIAGGGEADWISGGEGDDQLYGEVGDDEVHGDAGNDLVDGGSGHDTLTGGDGDDSVLGGDGDDVMAGGQGSDALKGGLGADVIFGDDGADQLEGETGADLLFGGAGDDLLSGGADADALSGDDGADLIQAGSGDDLASGGGGDDSIQGDGGNDVLTGEDGQDSLSGGDGNDTLAGGAGADTLVAGAGDDTVLVEADLVADVFIGGDGVDQLVAAVESAGVEFNLTLETVSGEVTGEDSFTSFEVFVGTTGDDTFVASEGQATLTGNGGSDLYDFRKGDTVEVPNSAYRVTDFDHDDILSFSNNLSGISVRRAQNLIEDHIENFFQDFSDRFGADEPRLRYFHEWTEEYKRTIVEVDFDRDQTVDLTLTLDGQLTLDVSQTIA